MVAAKHEATDLVRLLLTDFKVAIDEKTDDGKTALLFALQSRCWETIRLLLEVRADHMRLNQQEAQEERSILDYSGRNWEWKVLAEQLGRVFEVSTNEAARTWSIKRRKDGPL
ncbi:hypothetical protein DL771_004734 [Monosporascus sp. 5C6A]|nr:hypothetical protein DL771_004734 [Monosporascus sp. 5C6A]